MQDYQPQKAHLTHYLFFTGKGGVGKTTTASATAINLADAGKQVMLVSTDPASNLQDVFNTELTNKPQAINGVPGLFAANFDPVTAAGEYRESVVGPYRGVLPDAAVKNMEEQLSGSCTVEIASFNEFANFLTDPTIDQRFDYIIFDTAPTGHALRMLQLPAAWNNYLAENDRGASCLGQLAGMGDKKAVYAKAVATLSNSELTTLMLVTRPQKTALLEAARAAQELAAIGMQNQQLIINGTLKAPMDQASQAIYTQQQADLQQMPAILKEFTQYEVPLRAYNVTGLDKLRLVLQAEQPVLAAYPPLNNDYPTLDRIVADLIKTNKKIIFTMGKGGVGKTTVAVQITQKLVAQHKTVHLATTDPADHLDFFKTDDPAVTISHIDEQQVLQDYQAEVLAAARQTMQSADVDYVAEDLRSPCTQEIAVFRAFANIVAQNDSDVVVIDTAPTGHTLLLLDSTQSYAKEVQRTAGDVPQAIIELLPRLQDPAQTEIVMVTLPETTPVYESMRLNEDLKRAKIAHTWWLVNQSMLATQTTHPCLQARAQNEVEWIEKVKAISADHFAVEQWQPNFEQTLLTI
ncbi:arsenical pump-driving ATPase [Loigolactobacillus coryniformis subsp. coryniformis]|uniref:Arsenical pump-driving ATPase n=2 Tax=Loigolactobacillus coryniformis TaxID=1610 RepID=A0A0R1FCL4_9LACO|nr:arsenical pump-driving ATPase [Loigolactobacillus coryniformis]ATO43037.1 arsenical pump-driving ATPase [Loigolactobacillus coryniformis subsp. torquens DSM 20004 = KCTC 3535]ATO54785.1 arsenical pump-driving ATPase [Loigolactobacillus coryniformis subsp. coryniformis KCTC 3167 = DSM 20001]KRK16599.1 arsenical pump-driving ATPase [Loigolactobacillus coryniformis subsp. coryniformis KCTC 3167 = DSM 20001]KRK84171.1 arsenical pump-driving ATPase [Loigolactobacillus coryniformis subsp. torquens